MFILYNIIKTLITLPGILILLFLLGLILWKCKPRFAFTLILITTILLYLLSIPIISVQMAKPLQHYPALTNKDFKHPKAQAIVVLGYGRYANAPEFHADTVSLGSLACLRYAVYIYRKTHLPILVSGGSVFGEKLSEAKLMTTTLHDAFQVPVKWLETRSKNTKQNAEFATKILKQNHINTIYLITTAAHMSRSKRLFEKYSMRVIPAPTFFITLLSTNKPIINWFPTMKAFADSGQCIYEYLGLIKYWFINKFKENFSGVKHA